MTIIKNWLLEGLTDPKPPAASGDQWLDLAEQLWHGSPDEPTTVEAARIAFLPHWADALEAAAKESQLRILEMYANAHNLDADEYLAYVEKDGPL